MATKKKKPAEDLPKPANRREMVLFAIVSGKPDMILPRNKEEKYLRAIAEKINAIQAALDNISSN